MAVICNMVSLLNIKHEIQISLSLFVKYSDPHGHYGRFRFDATQTYELFYG